MDIIELSDTDTINDFSDFSDVETYDANSFLQNFQN